MLRVLATLLILCSWNSGWAAEKQESSSGGVCHCDEGKGCYCPQHGWVCDSEATCSQKWREHIAHCKSTVPPAKGSQSAGAAQATITPPTLEEMWRTVSQLRGSPTDRALRLKVIRIALALKPTPPTPEEAVKYEGRAEYAFKNAKTDADFADAAREYDKALLAAPWLAADYCNRGVALEKAGQLEEAKAAYEWCVAASPDAASATEARKRSAGADYALEKANKSFVGRWCVDPCRGHGDIYIDITRAEDGTFTAVFEGSGTASEVFRPDGQQAEIRITDTIEVGASYVYDLELSDDGLSLSGSRIRVHGDNRGSAVEMTLSRRRAAKKLESRIAPGGIGQGIEK